MMLQGRVDGALPEEREGEGVRDSASVNRDRDGKPLCVKRKMSASLCVARCRTAVIQLEREGEKEEVSLS